jgi:hypothetical protein
MLASADVFPFWHIALDALVAGVASFVVLWALHGRLKPSPVRGLAEAALVALVVALAVLAWRSFGNSPELNRDPVPGVSPNDALIPVVTSVWLGWYTAFRRPVDAARWDVARAVLALVVFVVNVVVI